MKCANCGNVNEKTLFDEKETFYCNVSDWTYPKYWQNNILP